MNGTRRRVGSAARTLVELGAIAAAVWVMGARAHAFTGPPKGYDASGHLSKAQFVLDNWPHVSWNYEWYSGQPSFAGSYPPGYHVLLALIAATCHVSLATAMNIVTYCSVLLIVIGLYATVRAATGSRLGALTAAGLLLGTPSLWAQMVVLGLYPRFAALAPMALALAAAVAHSRRGGRLRGAATCLLLAAALSIHPIVGVIGVGLIGAVYVLDPRRPVVTRLVSGTAVLAAAFGLSAYFYLPLALSKRSQSAFTDTEVSLSWHMLYSHGPRSLDGLTPVLLGLGLLLVCYAARALLPPTVPFAEKVALGRDVIFLSTLDGQTPVPASAGPATRRFARWFASVGSTSLPYRMALLFMVSSFAVFGYGLIGLAVPHFPYYVNGLQPTDLLVYPAFLLSGVVGLVVPPALRSLAGAGWLRRVLPVAAAAAAVAVIAPSIAGTSAALSPAEVTNDAVPQRASVLPAEVAGQYQYRFAGGADSTSSWVNEYSPVPQTRGYDDHGALHLDWQVWLEDGLLHKAVPEPQRAFMLDWYAVKWVDADSGTGDLSQYDSNPAAFTPLKSVAVRGLRIQTYRYEQASPILTATSAPTVLVVGDDQHYDLFLRALGLAGISSTALIPVHGPSSLDDVTPQLLRASSAVALYGATVADPSKDAALLRSYVAAGGGLFVDGSEATADLAGLAADPSSPLPVRASSTTLVPDTGWAWTSHGDATVVPADLASFGLPAYVTSGAWATQTATELQPWARPVLDTHGKTVVAAGTLGQGKVVWEGLNLPYHLGVYRSVTEAAFLGRLLLSTVPAHAAAAQAPVTLVDAEHWRIAGVTAGGVLFKVQDAADWQATVDGRTVPISTAGPGMMFVSLAGHTGPVTVDLRYRLSTVERLGYLVSAASLLGLLLLLASPRLWRALRRRVRLVTGELEPVLVPVQRKGSADSPVRLPQS